jgi:plastocyanin
MNRICLALIAAAVAAAPAAAQDWTHAQRLEVRMANFSYTPKTIHLKAGQPVVLHLVNTASGGHDFTAPGFFAAAQVRPQDRGLIEEGSVEFRGHETHDVALVPKAGRYPLKCSHAFHKTFGMTGEIVVD